jgi:hypothetical protein
MSTYLKDKLEKGIRHELLRDSKGNSKYIEIDTQVEEAINTIADRLNYMGNDKACLEAIMYSVHKMHRTIQQNFFRILSQVINEYSKLEYFDDRNKSSVEWCKKVADIQQYFPFV